MTALLTFSAWQSQLYVGCRRNLPDAQVVSMLALCSICPHRYPKSGTMRTFLLPRRVLTCRGNFCKREPARLETGT